ncbi:hypothetical protein GCM10025866_02270 [Naasia aerilata]|uniref:ABC transporter domain-containing protein n=1 Tax=Naasia aerilata TaxID=1162966 RepID=A0ABN6XLS2_9MICO|nr:hypothetical protein GCM10025866_02270 [Naasia aerilata]
MIRFDRVTKLYPGNSKPALNAVDVEIRAGEFVFLVGASGSGKSSFLRLVLKEEKPSSGEIHVLGQRLSSISNRKIPYFRRSLGVVFQDFRLLPNRTVYQNVAFTLQVIGKSKGFIQEAVPDVLQMVGLEESPSGSRTSSPAASSSASRSPAPWSTSRPSCWRTSRPATWTRSPARASCRSSSSSTSAARRWSWPPTTSASSTP